MPAARYWRVHTDATNAGTFFSVAEMAFLDGADTDLSVGGTAIASSEYSASFVAAKAFDKDPTVDSRWATALGAIPAWIGYIHSAPVAPAAVEIVCDNDPNNGNGTVPRGDADVLVEYSYDGASWARIAWVRSAGDWSNGATVRLAINHAAPSTRMPGRLKVAAASAYSVASVASAAAVQTAHDVEFGGPDTIAGKAERYIDADTNVPQKARVSLLRARDMQLARVTWSDPDTGDFAFAGVNTERHHYITLAEYPSNPDNPHAENYLRPVAGVSPLRGQSDAG